MVTNASRWQFWIDVGGTFTDCVARSASGELLTTKVLSSSIVKGRVDPASGVDVIVDGALVGKPDEFYRGFALRLLDDEGSTLESRQVTGFDGERGALTPDRPWSRHSEAHCYELVSPEEAPLLCVRQLMGLGLDADVGPFELRLGTTRGTNALLERNGPRTAFVTTEGFADVLLIGNQERPDLFALEVVKPMPLFATAIGIRGRLDARGTVLEELDFDEVRRKLGELRSDDIASIAICLMHSVVNPAHEEAVAEIARDLGFTQISVSSRTAPIAKLVPRGDTTVVDAYLTPVISSYVESIQSRVPQARLRLLTSAGGLSAPESFSGKDSILSGPAGGVVGAARVAEAAGFERAIGFDMGGTSTDVSRYDGDFEMEYETEKAGVRIVAPLLAIETVAAGGGSICDFDGERQTVGPSSAGAWPGPACYGSGGPLTVTDVNLFLGRAAQERFPFPLDRDAVERRLGEVCDALRASGHQRTPVEIATGYLEIANSRMSAAIHKISVARGYDIRGYTLVAFGGAGPQHACAVARDLGMKSVLVPYLAGVLSAQGAGLADVRKFAEQPVLLPFDDGSIVALAETFERLEERALSEIERDGVSASSVDPMRRSVEMRYLGQDATLEVDASRDDWRARFEDAHRQLYGFVHESRALEVVTARVECVASSGDGTGGSAAGGSRAVASSSRGRRSAVFDGNEVEAETFDAELMSMDDRVRGPAILAAPFHTIVVDPGWTARRNERGDWILEDDGETERRNADASGDGADVDPVQLEIFHQHFASIAEEMGIVLRRSALSTNVRERLDFSCAVFDRDGALVANAPHIPVHLGAMGECVRHVAEAVPELGPGDVVVTNDPFRGGSHLPDVTVVTPVYDDTSGELLFYTASRAHHAEIGGKRPGSMPPDSRSLADEGVLLRHLRVVHAGEPCFDELEALLRAGRYPSRSPAENLADIEAQIAANRAGSALLSRLIAERGREVVLGYMGHIQDAARRLMEAQLRRLPEGVRRFEDALDDGTRIVVELSVSNGVARVDFSGTDPVHASNLNATAAIVSSAVLYSFRCLIDRDIPLNDGVLAPIEIVLPECFLNPPARDDAEDCAAVAAGNVETSQRIVDTLLGALGVVAASQGTMNNFLFGNERFGYYETIAGGAGAGPTREGADAVHTHMTNTRITDPEVLERRYPVMLRRFEIRAGSGGEGLHRGGDGAVREIEFLEEVEVSILSQRRTQGPYGVGGGAAGKPGRNRLLRAGDDEWTTLDACVTFLAQPGDVVAIDTPGGGGWGVSPSIE
jgi:5-oxoprolinase (ATP-hydrolysing)